MNKNIKEENLSKESKSIYNFVIKTTNESSKKENDFVKKINLIENIIMEEDQEYPSSINFA